jgi:hypothetical protein
VCVSVSVCVSVCVSVSVSVSVCLCVCVCLCGGGGGVASLSLSLSLAVNVMLSLVSVSQAAASQQPAEPRGPDDLVSTHANAQPLPAHLAPVGAGQGQPYTQLHQHQQHTWASQQAPLSSTVSFVDPVALGGHWPGADIRGPFASNAMSGGGQQRPNLSGQPKQMAPEFEYIDPREAQPNMYSLGPALPTRNPTHASLGHASHSAPLALSDPRQGPPGVADQRAAHGTQERVAAVPPQAPFTGPLWEDSAVGILALHPSLLHHHQSLPPSFAAASLYGGAPPSEQQFVGQGVPYAQSAQPLQQLSTTQVHSTHPLQGTLSHARAVSSSSPLLSAKPLQTARPPLSPQLPTRQSEALLHADPSALAQLDTFAAQSPRRTVQSQRQAPSAAASHTPSVQSAQPGSRPASRHNSSGNVAAAAAKSYAEPQRPAGAVASHGRTQAPTLLVSDHASDNESVVSEVHLPAPSSLVNKAQHDPRAASLKRTTSAGSRQSSPSAQPTSARTRTPSTTPHASPALTRAHSQEQASRPGSARSQRELLSERSGITPINGRKDAPQTVNAQSARRERMPASRGSSSAVPAVAASQHNPALAHGPRSSVAFHKPSRQTLTIGSPASMRSMRSETMVMPVDERDRAPGNGPVYDDVSEAEQSDHNVARGHDGNRRLRSMQSSQDLSGDSHDERARCPPSRSRGTVGVAHSDQSQPRSVQDHDDSDEESGDNVSLRSGGDPRHAVAGLQQPSRRALSHNHRDSYEGEQTEEDIEGPRSVFDGDNDDFHGDFNHDEDGERYIAPSEPESHWDGQRSEHGEGSLHDEIHDQGSHTYRRGNETGSAVDDEELSARSYSHHGTFQTRSAVSRHDSRATVSPLSSQRSQHAHSKRDPQQDSRTQGRAPRPTSSHGGRSRRDDGASDTSAGSFAARSPRSRQVTQAHQQQQRARDAAGTHQSINRQAPANSMAMPLTDESDATLESDAPARSPRGRRDSRGPDSNDAGSGMPFGSGKKHASVPRQRRETLLAVSMTTQHAPAQASRIERQMTVMAEADDYNDYSDSLVLVHASSEPQPLGRAQERPSSTRGPSRLSAQEASDSQATPQASPEPRRTPSHANAGSSLPRSSNLYNQPPAAHSVDLTLSSTFESLTSRPTTAGPTPLAPSQSAPPLPPRLYSHDSRPMYLDQTHEAHVHLTQSANPAEEVCLVFFFCLFVSFVFGFVCLFVYTLAAWECTVSFSSLCQTPQDNMLATVVTNNPDSLIISLIGAPGVGVTVQSVDRSAQFSSRRPLRRGDRILAVNGRGCHRLDIPAIEALIAATTPPVELTVEHNPVLLQMLEAEQGRGVTLAAVRCC